MTAAERIAQRRLVTAGLSAAEWDRVAIGLKDRAFWSARVENLRYLQNAQNQLAGLLQHARTADGAFQSRQRVVSAIMRTAQDTGIATGTGALTDPGSAKRAAVIVDTNAGLARGYTDWAAGNSKGARAAFPAREFRRISARRNPRGAEWDDRWDAAFSPFDGATRAGSGRKVALKTHPGWAALSRFGTPWPPFDYSSGMGMVDVPYETCVALGVVPEKWVPGDEDPIDDFNRGLEASVHFAGPRDPAWQWLQRQMGDQVRYADGRIRWQADLIPERAARWEANPAYRQNTRLGQATPEAIRAARGTADIAGRQLSAPAETLGHIKQEHLGANETGANLIPLTEAEIAALPHVWRNPDDIRPAPKGDAVYIHKKTADGNWLRIVADRQHGGLHLKTYYKREAGASDVPL